MGKERRNIIAGLTVLSIVLLWGIGWFGNAGGRDRQWGSFLGNSPAGGKSLSSGHGQASGELEFSDGDQAGEELPLPQGQTGDKAPLSRGFVALTFDDGPHPVYTLRLLEGLKERGVPATFFLIGQNIDGNEEVIRKMKEDGHLIGNHSQNHMRLTKERAGEVCEQISRTNEKIREITGEVPEYVRPPYGSWSEELECLVPMKVVLWNLDTLDWKTQNKDKIVRHVMSHVEDGSVILLHDVYDTSVEAALEIVDRLLEEGYNFVTVDEMIID